LGERRGVPRCPRAFPGPCHPLPLRPRPPPDAARPTTRRPDSYHVPGRAESMDSDQRRAMSERQRNTVASFNFQPGSNRGPMQRSCPCPPSLRDGRTSTYARAATRCRETLRRADGGRTPHTTHGRNLPCSSGLCRSRSLQMPTRLAMVPARVGTFRSMISATPRQLVIPDQDLVRIDQPLWVRRWLPVRCPGDPDAWQAGVMEKERCSLRCPENVCSLARIASVGLRLIEPWALFAAVLSEAVKAPPTRRSRSLPLLLCRLGSTSDVHS
jgi:hypothetical protein